MSLPEQHSVTCPECGNTQAFTVWQSINVTLDPNLKERLLDGTLILFTCEKCGKAAPVSYNLLYHDMQQKLMFQLGGDTPDTEVEQSFGLVAEMIGAGYTYRLVASMNELIEKILVWDAGLDDRAVEVFKLLLLSELSESRRGDNARLYFSEVIGAPDSAEAQMQLVLVNDAGNTVITVPFREMFAICLSEVCDKLPDKTSEFKQWLRVDQGYALNYLESKRG